VKVIDSISKDNATTQKPNKYFFISV